MVSARNTLEGTLKQVSLTIPELALIAGTRAALGAGVALLVSDRLPHQRRRAIGWTLLSVGLVSTLPLVLEVVGRLHEIPRSENPQQPENVVEADVT